MTWLPHRVQVAELLFQVKYKTLRPMKKTRVVIVKDDQEIRKLVEEILSYEEDIESSSFIQQR